MRQLAQFLAVGGVVAIPADYRLFDDDLAAQPDPDGMKVRGKLPGRRLRDTSGSVAGCLADLARREIQCADSDHSRNARRDGAHHAGRSAGPSVEEIRRSHFCGSRPIATPPRTGNWLWTHRRSFTATWLPRPNCRMFFPHFFAICRIKGSVLECVPERRDAASATKTFS
jgi:hypothetical protein